MARPETWRRVEIGIVVGLLLLAVLAAVAKAAPSVPDCVDYRPPVERFAPIVTGAPPKLTASEPQAVLILVKSESCPSCVRLESQIKALRDSGQLGGVAFLTTYADRHRSLGQALMQGTDRTVPQLILFRPFERWQGAVTDGEVVAAVERIVGPEARRQPVARPEPRPAVIRTRPPTFTPQQPVYTPYTPQSDCPSCRRRW